MLEWFSSIWSRIRLFFSNITNYGRTNVFKPNEQVFNDNTSKNSNLDKGKNMHAQLPIHEAIEKNRYEEALKLIKEASQDDVNAKGRFGQTPLHLAIAAERLGSAFKGKRGDIIEELIKKGANVGAQDKDGETVVHYISRWLLNDPSKLDKKVKAWVEYDNNQYDDEALISILQCLIKGGANVDIKDNKGDTALDYILKFKKYNQSLAYNTIGALVNAGSIIKTEEQVFEILDGSIKFGKNSLKVVERAISQSKTPFNINYQDKYGDTALSLAYEKKKFDIANFLIEKGADASTIMPSTKKSFITHVIEDDLVASFPSLNYNTIIVNGFTPLTAAINSGSYESVKLLVEKYKADINFIDKHGRKAIHYAAGSGNIEITKYLLKHGANINDPDGAGNTALHYAAAHTDGDKNIAFFIKGGIDVNCQNKNGIRPIHDAIAKGNFYNFQTLLELGASLEMKDFQGVKKIEPLFVINILMRNHPIAHDLLEKVQPSLWEKIKNFLGGKTNLDKILEVSVNFSQGQKYTILHWVVENNRSDIFEVLKPYIKSKHINCKEKEWGFTPLHVAVKANNVEMIKYLLGCGADVNALNNLDEDSYSPMKIAKSVDVVLMLVKAGADIKSERGKEELASVMMNFAKKRDAKSLETLLSHPLLKEAIDVNARASPGDYNNVTMLGVAAWQGDIETLKILSKHGANANLRSINDGDHGSTILCHLAQNYTKEDQAKKNNIKDIMRLLILLFNADLTLKDNKQKTPLDYLQDPKLKEDLKNIKELRGKINETCDTTTNATDFILQYLEKNQGKSIEDCVKHLSENLNQLVDESPNKKSKVSPTFDDSKVEGVTKGNRGCAMM